ncbi:MAG: MBL fold metallo-hydrolase [Anaerolineae bacterium]|nr:MBL fold metallo-hydrolase [Anaerolineae bacterium]
MTTIHHLNCGSIVPRFAPKTARSITYCLLVETNQGLVLVDTGFGSQDYTRPSLIMRLFLWLIGSPRDMDETAARQVIRLGYNIEDVRHIVLTHLNLDHAGGLRDFPLAQVHLLRTEYEAAIHPRSLVERGCDASHWAHGPKWVFHDQVSKQWYGFDCIQIIEGLDPAILLIPLPGHTRGHCGVAIETEEGWLLNCGDAASPFNRNSDLHQLADEQQFLNFLPGWVVRSIIGSNVSRLCELKREHGDSICFISSHDIYSFAEHESS